MAVSKVGGANMIAHAQWPLCPPFPRVAVFNVTPAIREIQPNRRKHVPVC